MGGTVSTGEDNDDLVDNLLEQACITSGPVESVFRAVDRALYFTKESRHSAYKDTAWRSDNLHLSAPCIYSAVLENLSLRRGHSFLNIGSGTGYVSTMVGLIIGSGSVNHGVELYADVVNYANQRLKDFEATSTAVDMFDFCPPQFVCGNGLLLGGGRQYDRIYCGARCPTVQLPYLKQLLKVGGVLVVPVNDHLKRIERLGPDQWDVQNKLSVSFAPLIEPRAAEQREPEPAMPMVVPASLQQLSRALIRRVLRDLLVTARPDLTEGPVRSPRPARRCRVQESRHSEQALRIQRFVIPLLNSAGDGDGDEEGEGDEARGRHQRQLRHFGEVLYGAVARMARDEWERASQQEDESGESGNEEADEELVDAAAPPTPPQQPPAAEEPTPGGGEAPAVTEADREDSPSKADSGEVAAVATADRAGVKRTSDAAAAGTSDGQKRGRRDKVDSGLGDSDDAVPPPAAAAAGEPGAEDHRRSRSESADDSDSDSDSSEEEWSQATGEAAAAGDGQRAGGRRLPSSLVIGLPSVGGQHAFSAPRRRRLRRAPSDSEEADEGCPLGQRRRRRQQARQPTEERAKAFSDQLRQRVSQLPLPHQLRVYVNLDRPL